MGPGEGSSGQASGAEAPAARGMRVWPTWDLELLFGRGILAGKRAESVAKLKRAGGVLRTVLSVLGGSFKFSQMVSIVNHTYLIFPKLSYSPQDATTE